MPSQTAVNVSGTWRTIGATGLYARVSGVWQQMNFGYAKVSGAWQTVYIKDNTGPASVGSAKATFFGGIDGMVINYNNPGDADFSYCNVYVSTGGGAITSYNGVAGAPGQNINVYHYSNPFFAVMDIAITPYDTNGNAGTTVSFQSMQWTGITRGRVPTPYSFQGNRTWSFHAWASTSESMVGSARSDRITA